MEQANSGSGLGAAGLFTTTSIFDNVLMLIVCFIGCCLNQRLLESDPAPFVEQSGDQIEPREPPRWERVPWGLCTSILNMAAYWTLRSHTPALAVWVHYGLMVKIFFCPSKFASTLPDRAPWDDPRTTRILLDRHQCRNFSGVCRQVSGWLCLVEDSQPGLLRSVLGFRKVDAVRPIDLEKGTLYAPEGARRRTV